MTILIFSDTFEEARVLSGVFLTLTYNLASQMIEGLWNQVLDKLKERISHNSFETWIKPIVPKKGKDDRLILEVPNNFFLDWIKENYWEILSDAVSDVFGDQTLLTLKIRKEKRDYLRYLREEGEEEAEEDERIRQALRNFNPRYTFENFVVGSGNQFAHAVAMAVADSPGQRYNPLFIYGGVGLGKTHLLNAIGHRIIKNRTIKDPTKVCYLSAEEFTNELINSIRYERTDQFRKKFRNIDVLLIDDIQFLAGKERTQIEFFHTFNSLYENKKQIVLTSDRFPREISPIEERLRSRFEWGLIADIQPPDIETKVAILKKKAELENISLPNDVAFYLASRIDSNIRVLEGCLVRLGAFASLTKKEITLEMAKEVLKHIIPERERIKIERVQEIVANYFNIKVRELKSKKRLRQLVIPRQVAMYLSKELTDASLVEIGEKFGGKDHSTVIYAIKKVEEKIEKDPAFQRFLEDIKRKIIS